MTTSYRGAIIDTNILTEVRLFMDDKMYILTYEHGGYVLWGEWLKPRLRDIERWLDKYPKLKIGLDYESFTFDEYTRCDPEIVETVGRLLKKYPGRVGLGATTYGQPLALTISEESNARQLSYAVRTNLHYFGVTPNVYSISEFALHNQTPQLINQCGYDAAMLRSHVMGYGYPKNFDCAWGLWTGKDKTAVPAVPTYPEQGRGYNCTTLDNWILSRWSEGEAGYELEDFEEKFKKYKPLLASRYDDVCQPIERLTEYVESKDNYEYALLEDIPSIYGEATQVLETTDNDFHVQMPWGYCGNEIFNGVRASEVGAVQAEKLNALSVMLGGESLEKQSEDAWKYALAAQHHDVTICGLLDLSRRFIPESVELSDGVKAQSICALAERFANKDGESLLVSNLHSFAVNEWVEVECDKAYDVFDGDTKIDSEYESGKLRVCVNLSPFTTKRYLLREAAICDESAFSWDCVTGELTTPYYKLSLNEKGIAYVADKSGRKIFDNAQGALFTAWVDGEDRVSVGEWTVEANAHSAVATQMGKLGTIGYTFEMRLTDSSERIDCRTKFEMCGQLVGRTDVTQGRPVPLTRNGHHHEDKLCFVMNACLDSDRRMVRDLPYSISDWNGALLKTEEYWYPNDLILIDTEVPAEESFNSTTYMHGIYWLCLRDSKNGLAVFNRGCMGSAIQGNRMLIPLLYSNEYMCGTRILEGEFEDEFAILPFDSSVSDSQLHSKALSYAYQPEAAIIRAGDGDISSFTAAQLDCDTSAVVLTSLYPENGYVFARMCNYSDETATATFIPSVGTVDAQTDLLGNVTEEINDGKLTFRPWEVKTVRIKL